MTAPHIVDPARLLDQAVSDASPDLMRHLLSTVINALLSAEADAVCGAEYGQASPERLAQRNGYRHRDLDLRTGTIDVAEPHWVGWRLHRWETRMDSCRRTQPRGSRPRVATAQRRRPLRCGW